MPLPSREATPPMALGPFRRRARLDELRRLGKLFACRQPPRAARISHARNPPR